MEDWTAETNLEAVIGASHGEPRTNRAKLAKNGGSIPASSPNRTAAPRAGVPGSSNQIAASSPRETWAASAGSIW